MFTVTNKLIKYRNYDKKIFYVEFNLIIKVPHATYIAELTKQLKRKSLFCLLFI